MGKNNRESSLVDVAFKGLLLEYRIRYNKDHKCASLTKIFNFNWNVGSPLSFVQCMPDKYKVPLDPVAAYRAYYAGEKARFAKWKLGAPDWWQGKL